MAPGQRWRTIAAGIVLVAAAAMPAVAQEDSNMAAVSPASRNASGAVVPVSGSTYLTPAASEKCCSGGPTTLWDQWRSRRAGPNRPSATEDCCPTSQMTWWERWKWHRSQHKQHMQEAFMGYPEEFEEPPLGASLYAHDKTQIANGEAARMVLYRYDFEEGRDQLNRRGMDQLAKIAALLPGNFFPVVIEPTASQPELDESRRQAVLHELNLGRFPVPAERVTVGRPIAAGLSGQEAMIVHGTLLINTTRGGPPIPRAEVRGGGTAVSR